MVKDKLVLENIWGASLEENNSKDQMLLISTVVSW